MSARLMAPPPPARFRLLVWLLLALEALLVLSLALGPGQRALIDLTGHSDFALHLLAFGLASSLAGSLWPAAPVALGLAACVVLIEAVQLAIAEREASLIDLLAGSIGIALGLGFTLMVQSLLRKALA
jgi:VanZ family protein